MIPLPFALKRWVPGYAARWRRRYAAMLDEIHRCAPRLQFGQDGATPWLEDSDAGIRLHGFLTEPKNVEVYEMLEHELPTSLPKTHFRLVKDYINRYVYPHMRPDLKPAGYAAERLWGFHAQHKDAIEDYPDASARDLLREAFRPSAGEVIIDGGAFLGFGEIRLAPDIRGGRIIAIEANPDCHALLVRNLTHNRVDGVTALHAAVWEREGELELETGYAQANSLVEEVHRGERRVPVATITVDGIIRRYGLTRLDMLSLTLNGAEVEALRAASYTLDTLRPRIRLAGWYRRGGVPIWQITKEALERHRYRVFVGSRGNVMALPRERT